MASFLRFTKPCFNHRKAIVAVTTHLKRKGLEIIPAAATVPHRLYSGGSSLKVEKETGFALVTMNRPRVNSYNREFLLELTETINDLEADPKMEGLILTSAIPKIFSGGLELTEMYNRPHEYTDIFWKALQEFWMALYVSRLTTIAALNGHAPAAGCAVAVSCDYRIMAEGSFTIGFNEVHLGLVVPFWLKNVFINVLGEREAEKALILGTLYKSSEALKIGLVDEVVALENVQERAKEVMRKWIKIPAQARTWSKRLVRDPTLNKLKEVQESDIRFFTNLIQQPLVQEQMGQYLAMLQKK